MRQSAGISFSIYRVSYSVAVRCWQPNFAFTDAYFFRPQLDQLKVNFNTGQNWDWIWSQLHLFIALWIIPENGFTAAHFRSNIWRILQDHFTRSHCEIFRIFWPLGNTFRILWSAQYVRSKIVANKMIPISSSQICLTLTWSSTMVRDAWLKTWFWMPSQIRLELGDGQIAWVSWIFVFLIRWVFLLEIKTLPLFENLKWPTFSNYF